jgi:YD repeat-containing protein
MSLRFAIGILAVAALGYFVASAQAQQETFSATYQCIVGPPPVVGWTWTNTFTLDKEFLRLGDTLHGTLSSGYNYSACGGTGNSVPIDAFTRSQDWAVGNWVVTDSAGTHTYSSSNFAVINGTDGNYTGTFTYTPAYPPTNPPYPVQFVVGNGGPDNPTILWATFGPADNSPDLGSSSPRSGCEGICGSPINLASGNTWIQRQDYSLPGLGGGLQLTRTWNSMWPDNFPFQQLGMFGDSWQSTYEEHIQTTQAGANYWRADGSAWEFTYNSQTKAYTLASPLDARASLSFSSHTALFTVVLLDGSQRIFNSAGYLTALIDRNGNQVTVAHDSSNRITQVTDPAGRVLTFNLCGAQLSQPRVQHSRRGGEHCNVCI